MSSKWANIPCEIKNYLDWAFGPIDQEYCLRVFHDFDPQKLTFGYKVLETESKVWARCPEIGGHIRCECHTENFWCYYQVPRT